MASYNVAPLQRLVEQFERLPGIGSKTAQRLAYFVLNMSEERAKEFSDAILQAHKTIRRCEICCNFSDQERCPICRNEARDKSVICVVETPRDAIAIEGTGEYKGTYHVLHGVISPLDEVGPEDITVKELLSRISADEVQEVIMATGSNVEGELTAMYISKLLKPLGVKVTRLAYGLPVGSDLQYADSVTLTRALMGRQEL